MSDINRGDRFVAYPGYRLADRLFIEVTRVARDGTWADIKVCNWAVMWTKRQPLENGRPPESIPFQWSQWDLNAQERDWERKRAERAPLPTP